MEKINLTYRPFGEGALLIAWPSRMEEKILYDILSLQEIIEGTMGAQIEETQSTYHSLAIFFNPEIVSYPVLLDTVKKIRSGYNSHQAHADTIVWEIPVCYDQQFGIDLQAISESNGLSIDDIIELHSKRIYTVYFTGFLPGFLYMGGLPERLFTPRKQTPRPRIPKGAVAIGGEQTGIYPQESPGGWNIIGNSPISLFEVRDNPPCMISAGDKIKFIPISRAEHTVLVEEINAGFYELKPKRL